MAVKIISAIPKVGVGRVIGIARAFGARSKPMTRDAIANKLNLRAGTGSANNRVIAAKKFGLIETGRTGGYVLTDLGRRLSTTDPAREDILAAIRNVESFARLIDGAEGDPGDLAEADVRSGLEAAGVTERELDSATRVFISSWKYRLLGPAAEMADEVGGDDTRPDATGLDTIVPATTPGPVGDAAPSSTPPPSAGRPFVDHEMVRWVLGQAPAVGEPWPADRYEAWSALLHSTINFVFPDTARDGSTSR